MKVTLLLENTSLFGKYLNSEHGFSAWIEDEDKKILFDTGFSDKFIKNAIELGIDLRNADYVILSHAHRDHSGGMKHLLQWYENNGMYRKPTLIYCDDLLFNRIYNFKKNRQAGFDVSKEVLEKYFNVICSPGPIWLTSNLCYMGKTEITNDYEHKVPQISMRLVGDKYIPDVVEEDTQLCYRHSNKTDCSVVAACAHYGICNIMEYAKKLTGANHVHTYLGGSHLRIDEVPQSQVDKTCEYVGKQNLNRFYICHDTDLHCKLALWNTVPNNSIEAGTGLVVDFD